MQGKVLSLANALFTQFKVALLKADCDLDDAIFLVFVDHGVDTPVAATDSFLSDIASGARIATSSALASKTFTAGVFDAADITVTSVTGASFESIVFYDDTPGSDATRDLILFLDTATGLPTTPNGADITVQFDNGANKIFALN